MKLQSYFIILLVSIVPRVSFADSVNSPNIQMNVDTNRAASTGTGAGDQSVSVNTITIAETMLVEYSSGSGKAILIKAKDGYQFDPASPVAVASTTIGFNGSAVGAGAQVTPTGVANEALTIQLTSGTSQSAQDIIRITGIKLRILSAAGAAGPAKQTLEVTTVSAGGAFTNQGIVSASIAKGKPAKLQFVAQPGDNQAGVALLPQVKLVDFGGNLITNDQRTIAMSLSTNPGVAQLLGTTSRDTADGNASWVATDQLNITTAATGYVLRAEASGATFHFGNTVDSELFDISAAAPGGMVFSTQPVDTTAGGDILLSVSLTDGFGNAVTTSGVAVKLESSSNPGGWPLLVDSSLTKDTVNGVAAWTAADHLRITKAVSGYTLAASGLGSPIVTNSFDVKAGDGTHPRFAVQPSDISEESAFSPALVVNLEDEFGNVSTSTQTVNLSIEGTECAASLSGGSAQAVNGVATFSSVSIDEPCKDIFLVATAGGKLGAVSEIFDVLANDELAISIRNLVLKRGKRFQFISNGTFTPSTAEADDPTKNGGVLTVTGTTGSVVYPLPQSGWSKIGSGFKFKNKKCRSVLVQANKVSAKCTGRTGSLKDPETKLNVVLSLGSETAKYCGSCGGTSRGNPNKIFKRTNCGVPPSCE